MKYRIMLSLSLALLLVAAAALWTVFDAAGNAQAQSRATTADRIIAERAVDYPTDI
ncbi:MAG: hypothetical protein RQ847_01445 [Wenzhouxiangellaceae bacterium]|nr:hypothetical protein [Wenzhouxiangellaceae bacterium]